MLRADRWSSVDSTFSFLILFFFFRHNHSFSQRSNTTDNNTIGDVGSAAYVEYSKDHNGTVYEVEMYFMSEIDA